MTSGLFHILQSPYNVVRYTLSNINSVASTYFTVDSVTGWITVRVPLNLDVNSNNNQYIVSPLTFIYSGYILLS